MLTLHRFTAFSISYFKHWRINNLYEIIFCFIFAEEGEGVGLN